MKGFADCHIHIRGGKFEEIRPMLDDVASLGVTDAALLALPYRSVSENLSVLYWKMNYQKMKIRAFGGLHQTDRYAEVPYEQQVMRMLELGCDGIKLMDMCPELRSINKRGINHSAYDKMFSLLEELSTPVLIHANDPKECWEEPDVGNMSGLSIYKGGYLNKGYLTFQEIFAECFEMLDKHPKLNVTFAHFFFLSSNIEEAVRVMETYPNVKFDLTPGTDMYFHFLKDVDGWHEFFTKYSDRILFGTDTNTYKDFNKEINELVYTFLTHDNTEFIMPCYGNWSIPGLGLDEKTIEKICYTNFIEFVGNETKPVDVEGFYKSAEFVLAEMKKYPECKYYDAGAKVFPGLAADPTQQTAVNFFERVLTERK